MNRFSKAILLEVFLCFFCVSFAFGQPDASYDELLKKAENCISYGKYFEAYATCFRAVQRYPENAGEAAARFLELDAVFRLQPGLGDYTDDEAFAAGYKALMADAAAYFNENEEYTVTCRYDSDFQKQVTSYYGDDYWYESADAVLVTVHHDPLFTFFDLTMQDAILGNERYGNLSEAYSLPDTWTSVASEDMNFSLQFDMRDAQGKVYTGSFTAYESRFYSDTDEEYDGQIYLVEDKKIPFDRIARDNQPVVIRNMSSENLDGSGFHTVPLSRVSSMKTDDWYTRSWISSYRSDAPEFILLQMKKSYGWKEELPFFIDMPDGFMYTRTAYTRNRYGEMEVHPAAWFISAEELYERYPEDYQFASENLRRNAIPFWVWKYLDGVKGEVFALPKNFGFIRGGYDELSNHELVASFVDEDVISFGAAEMNQLYRENGPFDFSYRDNNHLDQYFMTQVAGGNPGSLDASFISPKNRTQAAVQDFFISKQPLSYLGVNVLSWKLSGLQATDPEYCINARSNVWANADYLNRLSILCGYEPCYTIAENVVGDRYIAGCDFSKDGFRFPTLDELELVLARDPSLLRDSRNGQYASIVIQNAISESYCDPYVYAATLSGDGVSRYGVSGDGDTVSSADASYMRFFFVRSTPAESTRLTALQNEGRKPDAAVVQKALSSMNEVFVQGGDFTYGKKYRTRSAEKQIVVTADSYYMADIPVTQELYRAVTRQRPFDNMTSDLNYPVTGISLLDACVFCNLLSLETGYECVYSFSGDNSPEYWMSFLGTDPAGVTITADYTKNGYRLPTNIEWEYACAGGTFGGKGKNDAGKSAKPTETVALCRTGKANSLGLYDMVSTCAEMIYDSTSLYDRPFADGMGDKTSTVMKISNGGEMLCRGGYDNGEYLTRKKYDIQDINRSYTFSSRNVTFRLVRNAE